MFYTLDPTSPEDSLRPAHSASAPGMEEKMANGGVPPAPSKRTFLADAHAYAGQAYSTTVKTFQPLGDAAVGYSKETYSWAKAGGTWRMILLAAAAGVLACIAGGVLALIVVTVSVGCGLLFFTAMLGLGALATFLLAVCGFATLVFCGSVLAAAAIIGAVASAAVCCVVLASVWVLGAWAVFSLFQMSWKLISGFLVKKKKGDSEASYNGETYSN